MTNNFILLIDQNTNDLLIALNFGDNHLSSFIKLEKSAFAVHPNRPAGDEYSFPDYEMGRRTKQRWEIFLGSYLNKIN